jgi:2-polyprenyl-3-methyl-5-hydroxy-6-metoxy-1,4-benzoquinol methylase/Zn ribbon nucleic-acid-binding protein
MEIIKHCPVCEKQNFREFLRGRDLFLSGEEFTIVECVECGFRFTNPRPDEKEIIRYYDSPDYIAHDSGKRTLVQSIYKTVRNVSIRNKYSIVKKSSAGKTLLDIGCGTGEFLNYCRKKNYITKGIEPNEKARNFSIKEFKLPVFDENELDNFSPASFDIITMWHVLEHVHKLNERMRRIFQLLKPDGTLIVAVPNSDSWDAVNYRDFWAAYDLPRHLYHFTRDSLKKLVTKNCFSVEAIIPLKFDAFYISLLSEKYMAGKEKYVSAFTNGIRSNVSARKNENNYSSLIYICKIAREAK